MSRNGTVVDYAYDAAGRLASVTGPDAWVAYDYDALGRVVRIENAHQRGCRGRRPCSRSPVSAKAVQVRGTSRSAVTLT